MRVLVACEYSGTVRDAFTALGYDAMSCDLLPTEKPGKHYQGDVLEVINDGWDLIIAHPPCTYLTCRAQSHNMRLSRNREKENAIDFFMKMINAPAQFVAVENPKGIMNSFFKKPSQCIQPYFFGDSAMKLTCLWLKNLPLLFHSFNGDLFSVKTHVSRPEPTYIGKNGHRIYWLDALGSNVPERWKIRSKTFPGVASAMASQWGAYVEQQINSKKIYA